MNLEILIFPCAGEYCHEMFFNSPPPTHTKKHIEKNSENDAQPLEQCPLVGQIESTPKPQEWLL